jgi:hypothetical protein
MEEYDGGVAGPWDVDGLLLPPELKAEGARRLVLDARPLRDGEDWREALRRSFIRLSRKSPSNLTRSSCAHSSPYSPWDEAPGLKGPVLCPAMVGWW